MKLTIAHLYPAEMNIYGDRGNVITLRQRLAWRGIDTDVKNIGVGDKFDLNRADIIFGGGGQDKGQHIVAKDLKKRSKNLHQAALNGVVMLTICGTYQLFGRKFTTKSGQVLPGIGLFKAETEGSDQRMIGNLVAKSPWGQLVGFENHSGQTLLDDDQPALAAVRKGYGNNGERTAEGAVSMNVFGSYLHGPLLPKNPHLADELIRRALLRHRPARSLKELNDRLELKAARLAARRPQ